MTFWPFCSVQFPFWFCHFVSPISSFFFCAEVFGLRYNPSITAIPECCSNDFSFISTGNKIESHWRWFYLLLNFSTLFPISYHTFQPFLPNQMWFCIILWLAKFACRRYCHKLHICKYLITKLDHWQTTMKTKQLSHHYSLSFVYHTRLTIDQIFKEKDAVSLYSEFVLQSRWLKKHNWTQNPSLLFLLSLNLLFELQSKTKQKQNKKHKLLCIWKQVPFEKSVSPIMN